MFLPDLVVRSRRVVTPRGTRPAAIHVRAGRIIGVLGLDDVPAGCPIDEAGNAVVLPGIIDIQARATANSLETVTRSAAAGGITTVLLPPFNRDDADGKFWADVGSLAIVTAGSVIDLPALKQAGAFGVVCERKSEADLRAIMPALTRLNATLVSDVSDVSATSEILIRLCREFHTRTHLLRFGASDLLAPLFHARAARLPITAATDPESLCLVANEKDRENRELIWAALAGGVIQMIASGRAPLETNLPVLWREARPRGYTLDRVAEWLSLAPARLIGIDRKGAVDVGFDADLVVFDADAGAVARTYLRGTQVYQKGTPFSAACGKLLLRRH